MHIFRPILVFLRVQMRIRLEKCVKSLQKFTKAEPKRARFERKLTEIIVF